MPILKTIMLKWASSGTDMERPWRPRIEARLPGAALPRPRVPRGPLPGPSGELSDSEPPSGHSLTLWRSSSSLDAGLWVIVGPRGDGGRQHHRRLAGEGAGVVVRPGAQALWRPRVHSVDKHGPGQWLQAARGRQAGGWTHPQTLLPPPSSLLSCRAHTPPPPPQPCHAACTCLLPCPWPCSQPPASSAPHFAADPARRCPRNRRITAGAAGPLCQARDNAAKISPGQTGGRPTGTLPSWPQPGPSSREVLPAFCSRCLPDDREEAEM